jgi:hypothetical protein
MEAFYTIVGMLAFGIVVVVAGIKIERQLR